MEFNRSEHNKKIASLRGESWRKNNVFARFDKSLIKSSLKTLRVERGLSQRDLAKKLEGVSQSRLHRIEIGEVKVDEKTAKIIATTLNAPFNLLFQKGDNKKYLAI